MRASRSSRSAATPTRSGWRQQNDIEPFTQEVLAGALRSIVGGLTVEQIIRDRAAFAQRVADESETSLTGQGLILDTFQIQDVTDDGSYLADLGRPEAARIGQAASIAEANARQAAEQARIKAEEEIAVSQRALALKQAEIKAETDAAAAHAAASGPLAQAERDQSTDLGGHGVGEGRHLLEDVHGAVVVQLVHRVEAETVDVEVAEPQGDVVEDPGAHRVAAGGVVPGEGLRLGRQPRRPGAPGAVRRGAPARRVPAPGGRTPARPRAGAREGRRRLGRLRVAGPRRPLRRPRVVRTAPAVPAARSR